MNKIHHKIFFSLVRTLIKSCVGVVRFHENQSIRYVQVPAKGYEFTYVQHKSYYGYRIRTILSPSLIETKVLFGFFFLQSYTAEKAELHTSTKYEVDLLRATPFSTYGGIKALSPTG